MAEQDRIHQQHLAATMVQSQGWRELVMLHVLTRAAQLDHLAAQPQLEATIRLEAIARKEELLGVVKLLYKLADVPNPFEVAREGLYTALLPREKDAHAPLTLPDSAQSLWPKRARRAGTVA